MKKNISKLISELSKQLIVLCKEESVAQAEIWWMLEKLTNKSKTKLIELEEITLTSQNWDLLQSWIDERTKDKKPLQYILGTVPFCDLEIIVEPPILIPRPETEEWTSWLIDHLEPVKNEPLKILDIGAGSGCIALALAKALPFAQIFGVDSDVRAIQLSKKNKEHNKINNAVFLQSNLYQELSQHKNSFDLIVSNPPYISEQEYKKLSKEVLDWENKGALVASDNGFAIYKKILGDAKSYLTHESLLSINNISRIVLEFGKGQDKELEKLFVYTNFTNISVYKDLEQIPRWITGIL